MGGNFLHYYCPIMFGPVYYQYFGLWSGARGQQCLSGGTEGLNGEVMWDSGGGSEWIELSLRLDGWRGGFSKPEWIIYHLVDLQSVRTPHGLLWMPEPRHLSVE